MTWVVAILTLAAAQATPGAPADAPAAGPELVDAVAAVERVALPAVPGAVSVQVRALESTVALQAPRGAAALARALRKGQRVICPGLEELPGEVRLRCRTRLLAAHLTRSPRGAALLEIDETHGLPWDGVDGPQLVAFEPAAAGLGEACPGSTATGRAECRIAAGDLAGARRELSAVVEGSQRPAADLRLGDLAWAEGDARAASTAWLAVKSAPWDRLAAARLCELSRACLSAEGWEARWAANGLPRPLARDMALRHARALAFAGRPVDALGLLSAASYASGACDAAAGLCRRLAHVALLEPGDRPTDALQFWIDLPQRDRGPAAWEEDLAAAALAERTGAPRYGANVLAAGAGRVPAHALDGYLLRTAELYLAAEDPIRAGVIAEFARVRAGKRGLTGPRWAEVLAAAQAPAPAPARAAPPLPELAAAEQVLQRARALDAGGKP